MEQRVFRVDFEDESVLVVEKLVPFLSQRADRGDKEGLFEFISRHKNIDIFPVHRLDRDVLGLMIFGKTRKAADDLSRQFRDREVKKVYEAQVHGAVSKDQETLIHYLTKNSKTNYVTVYPRPTPGAKKAELEYKVLDRSEKTTRIMVNLKTGRSHQIRVQLAKIGHPIVGDAKYMKRFKGEYQVGEGGTIQLKSVFLSLKNPETGEVLECSLVPNTGF